MKRRHWIGVTLALCLGIAAEPNAIKLSFAPYAVISARRVETMHLVREGKFDAAETLLSRVQEAYERRELDEFAAATAFAAFSTSDESLGAPLDRWVAKMPGSYCALLARARYRRARFNRGVSRELASRAIADYRAALAKNPRLMVAYGDLIDLAGSTRNESLYKTAVEAGLKIAPASWLVRDGMIGVGAVPGERLEEFIADAEMRAKENPLLWQLRSDVALERARGLWRKGQLEQALAIFESQAKSLDTFQIHKERARLLRLLQRHAEAAVAIDHAIALLPGKYDGYRERGWLRISTSHYAQAVADFRRGLEIEPLDPELNWGLGTALEAAGDVRGAIAALEVSTRWGSIAGAAQQLERLRSGGVAEPPAAPR